MIDRDRWYKNNQYVYYGDRIIGPVAPLDGCLQPAHLSSGHTGYNKSVDLFRERFHSRLTCAELRARMQSIVDSCGCHASKQRDSCDRGLLCSLPITYCVNSLLYVDFIHGLPKFGGCESYLVVTCGLIPFTRAFPATKRSQVKRLGKFWLNNGSNTTGHLRRCTLTRMCVSGVIVDGTSEYWTP